MTKHIRKLFMGVAALAALALGGSAIASAQQGGTPPAPAGQPAGGAEQTSGPDTDNIQSGDQTTPDTVGVSGKAASSQAEAPGTEQSPASEKQGAAEQPGTESAADSDGPGGHADEPGNPNADHQFSGAE